MNRPPSPPLPAVGRPGNPAARFAPCRTAALLLGLSLAPGAFGQTAGEPPTTLLDRPAMADASTTSEPIGTPASSTFPTEHVLEAVSSALPAGLPLDPGAIFPEEEVTPFGPLPATWPHLRLSLGDAVAMSLVHQHDLEVKRLEVERQGEAVQLEQAAFDPTISTSWSMTDRLGKQITQLGTINDNVSNRTELDSAWTRTAPSGTRTSVSLGLTRARSARAPNLFDSRLGLDLTHPLRQGAGTRVNLVAVRQAELDVQVAREEVEGYILALLAQVEHAYWQLLLTRRELAIVRESARLARQQQDETSRRINLGSLPESELAAAAAEVALREEAVINAESAAETARISLLRLLNPDLDRFWETKVTLADLPEVPDFEIREVDAHLRHALEARPELRRVRLLLQRDELELVQTRNGLLPRLDFFVALGKTGYAQTFGETVQEFGMRAYDLQAGLRFELDPGRRAARARDRRARYARRQREEAIRNLQQLIQEEVLTSVLEVQRALQQVEATTQTVARQREKRRAEEIKFSVGKTTAFQVAQAQRDEAASQIAAMKARIGVLNALTDLFRADGSLAARRGVVVAGRPEGPAAPGTASGTPAP
ncbi:MAG: TolC family protein [Candidatus Riflebacteria bacterium]|nr:TolC family protein [Candidatus Riflebacteria bacterium]